jgi:hypothetical protein
VSEEEEEVEEEEEEEEFIQNRTRAGKKGFGGEVSEHARVSERCSIKLHTVLVCLPSDPSESIFQGPASDMLFHHHPLLSPSLPFLPFQSEAVAQGFMSGCKQKMKPRQKPARPALEGGKRRRISSHASW